MPDRLEAPAARHMPLAGIRSRVVPAVLGLVMLAGLGVLGWQLLVVPWVAEQIRSRTGFGIQIGSAWPSGLGLSLRRVVVQGAPPFDRLPLARIDRMWVGFGGEGFSWYRPSKVVIRQARLTFLRAGGLDNLRGRRADPATAEAPGRDRARVEIDVQDARFEGFLHLGTGRALAVRSEELALHRAADGRLAVRATGFVADLPDVASLTAPSVRVIGGAGQDRTAAASGATLRVAGGGALLEHLTLSARIQDGRAHLSIRPARPAPDRPGSTATGFRFSADLDRQRISVVLGAASLPLAPMRRLAGRFGLELGAASAQFDVELDATPDGIGQLVYQARLEKAGLSHPKLDREPWTGLDLASAGNARFDVGQRRVEIEADVTAFGLPLSIRGWTTLRPRPAGSVNLATPPGQAPGCADLLAAQPAPIRQALSGLSLSGRFGLAATIAFDAARYEDLDLGIRLAPRCQVTNEPDAFEKLRAQLAPRRRIEEDTAARHPWPLDPGHPDFVPLEKIPKHLVDAFVTSEDGTFFEHPGVDLEMVRRALAYDLERGSLARGASTITQQVAKNLFLSRERTLGRKLLELVYAWRLEEAFSKNRILELYLNMVELGPGIRGVNAAAAAYFGKPLAGLSALEAAHLAALTPNPLGYARRFRDGRIDEGWLHRLYDLLGMMRRSGRLSAADLAAARQDRLVIRKI